MHVLKERIDKWLEKILIFLETVIAIITVGVMLGLLVELMYHILLNPSEFFHGEQSSVSAYLHHMMDIVIGLEFVKLLMHLTPANILEVLTMAIARGIIVDHGSAVDNLLSIACIIGMFAARRYLIPKNELHQEMDEAPHHSGRKHRHGKHGGKHEEKNEEKQETH